MEGEKQRECSPELESRATKGNPRESRTPNKVNIKDAFTNMEKAPLSSPFS